MVIFKFIFSSQRFSVKTRRIYASIAGLLQVNSTQLALKIAARDRFIILGRVDLCGLKFVQSRGDLIAARGL